MPQLLQWFILLPLLGFLICLLLPAKKEKLLAGIAITTAAIYVSTGLLFTGYWLLQGYPVLDSKHIVLYKTSSFEFFIDYYFDRVTAVYALVGGAILLLVAIFSRYYMHRDRGFKRYFSALLLFFLGYNLVIFAGNLETLFIGWEILGLCSFLLIAFYRDRYLPVKNALKVISVYRLGDVCLMLAMWMCHHLFHQNITFEQLRDPAFLPGYAAGNTNHFIFIGLMIGVAALVKSALLPFSSWLPRAMEGPTTSSAVFYGSLSIHLGAFLLLRTYPLWENVELAKIGILVAGALTAGVAAFITRVQSTVKTQIAYASITQMGLIFVELALGWHTIALIHFAGNAFLRTYQLLVSPSVLHYQVHDMFFNFKPVPTNRKPGFFHRFQQAAYILSIKEWNFDQSLFKFLWQPFKWIGQNMRFLVKKVSLALVSIVFLVGLFSFSVKEDMHEHFSDVLPLAFSLLGLILILTAFAERGDARRAWLLVLGGQGFVTLSVAWNGHVPAQQLWMYGGAVILSALVGFLCLGLVRSIDRDIILNRFHGYAYERPVLAFIFLLSCLGSFGFPFTPTFIGIDLLFTHIDPHQAGLMVLTALSFIFIELAMLRIYARIFLGQHKKLHHPVAFRSS